MALTEIKTSGIADDAVTTDKLANAINTERTANTSKPSLANDSNNRVVTGDGSGGLNGEANLTFDGTTLAATGAMSLSGTADPVTITVQNTDSNTATDSGGDIVFKGSKTNGDPLYFGGIGGRRRNQGSDETGYLALYRQNGDGSNAAVEALRVDHVGRLLKGATSSESSRSNTSARNPHVQISSPWSSGLGSTSITCTDDFPILFLNSNASYADNAGAGVITWSVKDGAGNYCNTAEIRSQIDGTPGNNDSPGELSFRTTADGSCQPTQRMKIHSTGNVEIDDGNLIIGTAGKGIDFSAAAGSASGATASVLDDYEEGTFTTSIGMTSGAVTHAEGATTSWTGYYVKTGNMCHVHVYVNEAEITGNGSGYMFMDGFPFTSHNGNYCAITITHNTLTYHDVKNGYVQPGNTIMYPVRDDSTAATFCNTGSTRYLMYGGTYRTA